MTKQEYAAKRKLYPSRMAAATRRYRAKYYHTPQACACGNMGVVRVGSSWSCSRCHSIEMSGEMSGGPITKTPKVYCDTAYRVHLR